MAQNAIKSLSGAPSLGGQAGGNLKAPSPRPREGRSSSRHRPRAHHLRGPRAPAADPAQQDRRGRGGGRDRPPPGKRPDATRQVSLREQIIERALASPHHPTSAGPDRRLPSYCRVPSTGRSHVSRRTIHSSYSGRNSVGASSNAPRRTSTSPVPSARLNSDDPQALQKCRLSVPADQLAVSPKTAKSLSRQTPNAMNGPPVSFRQVPQWHSPARTGGPFVAIRTAPQLQLPSRLVCLPVSPIASPWLHPSPGPCCPFTSTIAGKYGSLNDRHLSQ